MKRFSCCLIFILCVLFLSPVQAFADTQTVPFPLCNPNLEQVTNVMSTLSLNHASVSIADDNLVYSGKKLRPDINVALGDESLIRGYDYVVSFKNNVEAGTAKAIITGIDGMYGRVEKTFEIKRRPLVKDNLSLTKKSYVLGRDGAKPIVVVKDGNKVLEEGVDYKTVLRDCDKLGTGSIIVKGQGNYSGKAVATFEVVPDNSKPVLDYHELMLDVDRFTVADLTSRISSDESIYTTSDIEWSISDTSVVRLRNWDTGAVLAEHSGKGAAACIEAVAFGEADITVKLPNDKTDVCHVKVISPTDDPTGRTHTHDWNGRTYSLVSGSWGNEYVDAYLNNAERMMAAHPDFSGFGRDLKARTIWGYWQNELGVTWSEGDEKFKVSGPVLPYKGSSSGMDEISMEKKAGELSANDWLLLQTSKNQWEYLCHKVNGSWKVIDARAGSAGPNFNYFDGWIGVVWHSPFGLAGTYGNNHRGMGRYTWLCHSGAEEGYPHSHGCIHLGNYSSKLYWDTFMVAGRCTRVIAY